MNLITILLIIGQMYQPNDADEVARTRDKTFSYLKGVRRSARMDHSFDDIVTNGSNVKLPYIVRIDLLVTIDLLRQSTGTIITPVLILSSCRIMAIFKPQAVLLTWTDAQVVLGDGNRTLGMSDGRRIARINLHNKCSQDKSGSIVYDLSAIFLDKPLHFNPWVQPLVLYSQNLAEVAVGKTFLEAENTTCSVPGWFDGSDFVKSSAFNMKAHLMSEPECSEVCRIRPCLEDMKHHECLMVEYEKDHNCGKYTGNPLVCVTSLLSVLSFTPHSRCYTTVPMLNFIMKPEEVIRFVNEQITRARYSSKPYKRASKSTTGQNNYAMVLLFTTLVGCSTSIVVQ